MIKSKWKAGLLVLAVMTGLSGCGSESRDSSQDASVSSNTEAASSGTSSETTVATEKASDTDTTKDGSGATTEVTTEKVTVEKEEVVSEGMVPVTGDQLKDGTYEITVKSSSSMFEITACQLTVSEGSMTAKMIMGGKGYLYVYRGTSEEAEKAPESDLIPFAEEADGSHSFTFPVEALNQAVPCAAFSKKKELWYDRDLCFEAAGLPLEAYLEKPYKDASDLGLSDGEYQTSVTLTGGSGRASVDSPAKLTVSGGKATARIVWSSPNYDYMVVDGTKYLPVENPDSENSTFEIPVAGFDYPLPVRADTTAMSQAHEIEYTLTFDSEGLR
ncbi:MAG: hypothetical protein IJM25_03825 [Eubacterium sp.]|nr:hypothetical protein [Eubacterium sp.]